MKKENESVLIDFVSNLNDALEAAENADISVEREQFENFLAAMSIQKRSKYPALMIRLTDYTDLAALSIQYNLTMVRSAIVQIYNYYTANGLTVENFGALARTLIRKSSYSQIAC